MSLSPRDQKALSRIVELFHRLEKSRSREESFTEVSPELHELIHAIGELESSLDPLVQRLAEIKKHLLPPMTLKHFSAFSLPFERLLQRSVQDDDFLVLEGDATAAAAPEKLPLVFVLDNIRSAFNVGSCLRTAECLGAEKVYLCGYTPSPEQDKVARTAMGTENFVAWQAVPETAALLRELRAKAYHLVALETAEKALSLYEDFPPVPCAFIVGNERFGLAPELLALCDEVRKIPLRGQKNSLNVGVCLAVAGFEWSRQRNAR